MRKFTFLTILMLLFSSLLFSQSQRLVMAEEFTNASCSPCASQNPAFDALLTANATKITSIKYHTNWPGTDPMNAHNTQEVASRVTYYSVSGVPYCRIDGVAPTGSSYLGAPANLNQAKIDAAYAIPSPLDMQLQQVLSADQDSVYVTLLIHATQNVSGTLVAHIGVIEKTVTFLSAPGSNGEKIFHNVMVKLLPSKTGTSIGTSMNTGDYKLYKYGWALPSTIYKKTELAAVAFVQDNADKSVLQAANSSTNPVVPYYGNDATITAIDNVPGTICVNTLSPVVTIQNNGTQPLTSLQINYSVNGGTVSVYQWTGNLSSLQNYKVTLPALSFGLGQNNTLNVQVSNPNGTTDEYPSNDIATFSFSRAPFAKTPLNLNLKTDNNPDQTTWTVKTASGTTIAQGGPYTQGNTTMTIPITIANDDCYVFEINDAAGNGICCTNGYGYYQLTDSSGSILAEGSDFGSRAIHSFERNSSAIEELNVINDLEIYPNPVTDMINMRFNLDKPEIFQVEILNPTGQQVYNSGKMKGSAGANELSVNTLNLSSGVYLVKITAGQQIISRKITKQ